MATIGLGVLLEGIHIDAPNSFRLARGEGSRAQLYEIDRGGSRAAGGLGASLNDSYRYARIPAMAAAESDGEILLTPQGMAKLQAELDRLRRIRRPEIADQLRQAVDGGDLTENVGYEDAKHEQAFVEGRILTLEALLKRAVIVEGVPASEKVAFGSWVTVMERGGATESFQIVGSVEAAPNDGRISNESPLGKALLDHTVGEEVTVEAPDGLLFFEILDIQ